MPDCSVVRVTVPLECANRVRVTEPEVLTPPTRVDVWVSSTRGSMYHDHAEWLTRRTRRGEPPVAEVELSSCASDLACTTSLLARSKGSSQPDCDGAAAAIDMLARGPRTHAPNAIRRLRMPGGYRRPGDPREAGRRPHW
ncbi:hypothetical protein GCM10011366_29150 [Ornithinimicrobium tianjinense]|uniref:Uncharacterized protein n=1 Tax=Ornithinimicrobium tianjinense TaxID=1195761 RepID=A0A917FA06_9MICO|nr:hypothetical protein GCM10011366_29150 [Ornithinimicrobium tianjinense]